MSIKIIAMDDPNYLWEAEFEWEETDFSVKFTFDIHSQDYTLISVVDTYNKIKDFSGMMPTINAAINDMIPEVIEKINHHWEEDKWAMIYDTKQFNERYD